MNGKILGNKEKLAAGAKRVLSYIGLFNDLVAHDLKSKTGLSFYHCLRAWRLGFTRPSYKMYNLELSGNPEDFLSDVQQSKQIKLNDIFWETVYNKLIFGLLMKQSGIPTPEIKGIIRKGVFHTLADGKALPPLQFISFLKAGFEPLVIKPILGTHGRGIYILSTDNQSKKLNGEGISGVSLSEFISGLHNHLVCDFVRQSEYAAGLYPDTPNTIRIVTLWDVDKSQPFIAKAIQRIGTSRSYPVDNFMAGKGGLSAPIDLARGVLGLAANSGSDGKVMRHKKHPETQTDIFGQTVPAWPEICDRILSYASKLCFAPCIAWDLLPTAEGFSIIEGNPIPGMSAMQIHGPMLTDPRVRKFYEYYGVITKRRL